MKRIIVVLCILALAATLAGAQEAVRTRLARRLGLTEQQAEKFIAIYTDSAEELARARADVNVQKALLAKLLLDADANDREVERVLRQAMEAEIQVRMIQIRRELAGRRLIGDKRWRQLRDLLRRFAVLKARQAARDTPARTAPPELDEKDLALLQELADLLGE